MQEKVRVSVIPSSLAAGRRELNSRPLSFPHKSPEKTGPVETGRGASQNLPYKTGESGLPCSAVKNPLANARDMGLIPDPGGFYMLWAN